MPRKLFQRFFVRGAVPVALFSFVFLVPEAYSNPEKVAICHVRGPEARDMVLIDVSPNSVPAHRAHGDRDPVAGVCPAAIGGNGNPAGDSTGSNTSSGNPRGPKTDNNNSGGNSPGGGQPKVTLCHATGSAANPFIMETVAAPSVPVHLAGGDVYPANGSCPGTIEGGTPTATPEPVTMLLFGAGLAAVGYAARRRQNRNNPPE